MYFILELPKLISSQSEDGILDITPQFEAELTEDAKSLKVKMAILVEAISVIDMMKQSTEVCNFFNILSVLFFGIHIETILNFQSIKIHMQTELINVISKTSQHIRDFGTNQLPITQISTSNDLLSTESEITKKVKQEAQNAQPLVELIGLLLIQWKIISERHEILLELLKYSGKKHNVQGISLYTMQYYWSRVQAVVIIHCFVSEMKCKYINIDSNFFS